VKQEHLTEFFSFLQDDKLELMGDQLKVMWKIHLCEHKFWQSVNIELPSEPAPVLVDSDSARSGVATWGAPQLSHTAVWVSKLEQ
jgi:hypothetical protein